MSTPPTIVARMRICQPDGSESERWITTCVDPREGPFYRCRIYLADGESVLDGCYTERGNGDPGGFSDLEIGTPEDIKIDCRSQRCFPG
jgi:hypothetical protein